MWVFNLQKLLYKLKTHAKYKVGKYREVNEICYLGACTPNFLQILAALRPAGDTGIDFHSFKYPKMKYAVASILNILARMDMSAACALLGYEQEEEDRRKVSRIAFLKKLLNDARESREEKLTGAGLVNAFRRNEYVRLEKHKSSRLDEVLCPTDDLILKSENYSPYALVGLTGSDRSASHVMAVVYSNEGVLLMLDFEGKPSMRLCTSTRFCKLLHLLLFHVLGFSDSLRPHNVDKYTSLTPIQKTSSPTQRFMAKVEYDPL